MLDIGWSEMAVIAILALIVIGPKDLPRVMRTMGHWVRKARSVSREFQSSVDEMMREAELDDAKKAIQSAKSMSIDRALEETIDPTGSVKEEVRSVEAAAKSDASADNEVDGAAQDTSAVAKQEPAEEATAATVIKHPAQPAPPHSVVPPPDPHAAPKKTAEAPATEAIAAPPPPTIEETADATPPAPAAPAVEETAEPAPPPAPEPQDQIQDEPTTVDAGAATAEAAAAGTTGSPQAPEPDAPPAPEPATAESESELVAPPPPELPPEPETAAPAAPAAPDAPAESAATGTEVAAVSPSGLDDDSIRLLFDEGSAELADDAKQALQGLADDLTSDGNARVQLLAYASSADNSASRARRLSLSRALAVRAFLIDQGVRSTRMDVRALGNKSEGGPADRVDIMPASR